MAIEGITAHAPRILTAKNVGQVDAPHGDVVVSTRFRCLRNLSGHKFPHRCSSQELQEVLRICVRSVEARCPNLQVWTGMTQSERDSLVAARLLSPDFRWADPGRAAAIDVHWRKRNATACSVMVNEEDHLRIQAVRPGWNLKCVEGETLQIADALAASVAFAHSASFGYLASSPWNSGTGERRSVMVHLVGLATSRKLATVIRALGAYDITARGLYGERSRAAGAMAQISSTQGTEADFLGACEYLIREERLARSTVNRQMIQDHSEKAVLFITTARRVSLSDAYRALAWVRWAAHEEISDVKCLTTQVDQAISLLQLPGGSDELSVSVQRAAGIRSALGL